MQSSVYFPTETLFWWIEPWLKQTCEKSDSSLVNFLGFSIKTFSLPKPTVRTFSRKTEVLIQESHCRVFYKAQFKCLMPLSSSGQVALGRQWYMTCVHPVSILYCLYSLVREKPGKYSLVREKWGNEAVTLQTFTGVTKVPCFWILQEQTPLSNCLYSEAVLPTHCIMSTLLNSPCVFDGEQVEVEKEP